MLDLSQAIALGIVQGITEFLPISSSAHLILIRWLFGWQDPGLAFDVALHVGTLVAVLAYFRSDWIRLIRGGIDSLRERRIVSRDSRVAWLIVAATIPGAIVGAVAERFVERFFHGEEGGDAFQRAEAIAVVAAVLMIVGVVLYLADRAGRRKRDMSDLGLVGGIAVGLAQALAVIPGVSRSGSTISAGLALGLTRPAAARFSFLLSGPIIAGAAIKSGATLLSQGLPSAAFPAFLGGMVAAAIVGYAAIAFMLRFLERNSVLAFTIYRLAFGVLILALVIIRIS